MFDACEVRLSCVSLREKFVLRSCRDLGRIWMNMVVILSRNRVKAIFLTFVRDFLRYFKKCLFFFFIGREECLKGREDDRIIMFYRCCCWEGR